MQFCPAANPIHFLDILKRTSRQHPYSGFSRAIDRTLRSNICRFLPSIRPYRLRRTYRRRRKWSNYKEMTGVACVVDQHWEPCVDSSLPSCFPHFIVWKSKCYDFCFNISTEIKDDIAVIDILINYESYLVEVLGSLVQAKWHSVFKFQIIDEIEEIITGKSSFFFRRTSVWKWIVMLRISVIRFISCLLL